MNINNMSINEFIEKRDEFENLIFFGAGSHMTATMSLFKLYGLKMPIAICDNNKEKQGTTIYNIPIISFDEACSKFENIYVLITNLYYSEEVWEQTVERIPECNIFFYTGTIIIAAKKSYAFKKNPKLLDEEYIKEQLDYYYEMYKKNQNIKIITDCFLIQSDKEYVHLIDYLNKTNIDNIHLQYIENKRFLVEVSNAPNKKLESEHIEKSIGNIVKFNKYLQAKEIPFKYIQIPSKLHMLNDDELHRLYDDANKQADILIAGLEKNNVDLLDLRECLDKDNAIKWFFRTDFHWTSRAAFEVNKIICKDIAKIVKSDLNYDYLDINNYNVDIYKEKFLGYNGKLVGVLYAGGLEDFEMITPKYYTDFSWICKEKGYNKRGKAEDVLVYKQQLTTSYDTSQYMYSAYSIVHKHYTVIKNHLTKNKKKIFIINDSFTRYLSMFITQQFEEVHFFDFRQEDFSKKLFKAIENVQPDIVLMAYYPPHVLSNVNGFGINFDV